MLTSCHLNDKYREVYQSKVTSSLVYIYGQVTKHTTVKWPIGLTKSKKYHWSDIFPAKCLAKNITLFRLCALVIHDLLKDLHKIVSWTAK